MITTHPRRRAVALALSVAALLAPAASTRAASPDAVPAAAPALTTKARAAACPVVTDRLYAAADRRVDPGRITPAPVWRTDCKQLYRADNRAPAVIFQEGFHPKAPLDGQYDIERYVLVNQPSPFVSTTYDHDLYKKWKSGYNYYVDAPGGVDVNGTIGDTHKYADQEEVAFPGGIAREHIVGVCPVDTVRKTEIMAGCEDNPYYEPWRG
ncbi:ADP-ribosyltransferase [Streptomyces sp. SP18CS02]|uniref:ADP-ribosyltransferase n=1 Tax=Streptomyces sp. SP18CS02 TaxID=3002531 RepID=UPI002E782808|nr:ADP-ribosyltransferase [Streptomyces sp. SP18CS02]MEE1757088.1 ADP-ribosyltransferase [Streptomyces sp. SP18CS02]